MSDTGNKLVLAFGHSINSEEITLRRVPGRRGNTLNQVGQVMDELIAEERERIIAHLGTAFLGFVAHDPSQGLFMVGTDNIRRAIESIDPSRSTSPAEAIRTHGTRPPSAPEDRGAEHRGLRESSSAAPGPGAPAPGLQPEAQP